MIITLDKAGKLIPAEKIYKTLLDAGFNPREFYDRDGKSVAELYFEEKSGEERPEARREYHIHAHKHRMDGVEYIEDKYSEHDLRKLSPYELMGYIAGHGGSVNTCYSALVNVVGTQISRGYFDYAAFAVHVEREGKETLLFYCKDGRINDWEIGYFTPPAGKPGEADTENENDGYEY